MIIQPLVNIAEICARKGVKTIVLSPGSRCAPLTVAFVRHPEIKTYTISDERSAAFFALGIAQQLNEPVALLCTSGTASLNYYPAIAEAFYQQVPLVVFTADRPTEWIDQLDGQTIRQHNVYANHIKKSYQLPVDYSHTDAVWFLERTVNEAINLALSTSNGPVHINVPIREPFYPETNEVLVYDKNVRIFEYIQSVPLIPELVVKKIESSLKEAKKILILVGQFDYNKELLEILEDFTFKNHIVVLADVISNVPVQNKISHTDITLFNTQLHENLVPDLIISFGKSIVSKNIKTWLRKCTITQHIHIQNQVEIADYTQSIQTIIQSNPVDFLNQIKQVDCKNSDKNYLKAWKNLEINFENKINTYFKSIDFSEFEAIFEVTKLLPKDSILHLANSMSVRYANYLAIDPSIEVYANRGTSGIDGCTSTALGCAVSTNKIVTFVTGDMAFLYDRNAFWNNYLPSNLRIVVLNNQAGGIFRIIDGSSKLPELEEYFETHQQSSIENTAKDAGLEYYQITNREEFIKQKEEFYKNEGKSKVLEICTKSSINAAVLKTFTAKFKN